MNNSLQRNFIISVISVITLLIFPCEIPTEVYENPLDVDNEVFDLPALVFYPDSVGVNVGAGATVQVFAMEVNNLSGAHIQVSYDQNKLQVLSVNAGEFFSDVQDLIFITDDDPALGILDIYTSFLDGDTVSVSGTGSLANIVLTATSFGQSDVNYTGGCEFADPDDIPIVINGFGKGVIYAQ